MVDNSVETLSRVKEKFLRLLKKVNSVHFELETQETNSSSVDSVKKIRQRLFQEILRKKKIN